MSPITEDELRERLHAVSHPGTTAAVVAARAVAEGRRRRGRTRALGLVGVAAAVAAIAVVGTALGRDTASPTLPPVGPSATSPVATGPTTTPSTAPSTSPTSASTQGLMRLVALPHAGVKGQGDASDWLVEDWRSDPCGGESSPGTGVVASSALHQSAIELDLREGLLVFADEAQAVAFVDAQRASTGSCPAGRAAGATALSGAWPEGFVSTSWSTTDLARQVLGVARVGRAVAYASRSTEGGDQPTPNSAELSAVRTVLDDLAPRMCVYTAQGC